METRKWVRNVGLATRAMLGARQQDRGCAEREVGWGARSLKTRARKRPLSTSRVAKTKLWRRESVPYPREPTRHKRRRMKKEWAVAG
jgi:hypothetical protein